MDHTIFKNQQIMCCFVYSFVKPHLCHPQLHVTSIQHLPINVRHQENKARWIKWRTSMWTQLYGEDLCLSLFKLQFIKVKATQKICDQPRINPRHFGDSYFRWLKGWSLIREKLLDWQRSIGSSLCGERRLCWLTELFSLQLPKPTSFLTQCSVWVVSVLNQSKHEKATLSGFLETRCLKDLDRIDGEQMEVELEKFQRIHFIGNSRRDSKDDDWIKVWTGAIQRKDHLHVNVQWHWLEDCIANAPRVTECARRFTRGHWSFPGLGWEEMVWNSFQQTWWRMWQTAEGMMLNFAESGHPMIRATTALERGEWKAKEKYEIHPLQLWWWHDWIDSSNNHFRQSTQNGDTDRISLSDIRRTSWTIIDQTLLPRQFSENIDKGQFFIAFDEEGLDYLNTSCREYTLPRCEKHPTWEGGSVETGRSAQSWMWRSPFIKDVTVSRSWQNLYFETEQFLGFASRTKSTNT